MKCPTCATNELQGFTIGDMHAHRCDVCGGIWMGKSEVSEAEKMNPEQHWLDIALWEDKELLSAKPSDKICPVCNTPLATINWNDGTVVVDLCKTCGGLWLEKGEYQKMLDHIKESADDAIMEHYAETLATQMKEVVTGPKDLTNELADVWAVLKFFQWKVAAQHPALTELFEELPFTK